MTEKENLNPLVINKKVSNNRASGFTYDEDEEEDLDTPNNKENNLGIHKNKKIKTEGQNSNIFYFTLNELICIVNILGTALGIGVFTFPYILYKIGVINSLFIFIFLSASVYYTLDLLRRFVVDSQLFSYSKITQTILGNFWLKAYAIATFLFYMSNIVNYLKIVYDLAKNMMKFLNDIIPKIIYFILTFVIEIILCLYTNRNSKIFIFSLIIFVSSIIILFIVVIKGIIFLSTEDDKFKYFSFFTIKNSYSGWDSFLLITAKFIEFFYGYVYHSTFPTFLSDLENLGNNNTKRIHNTSYFIICVYYFIFSFFGLFSINDKNLYKKQLFIDGEDLDENTALICIFKTILIIYFFSFVPMRYIIIRDNYTSLIGKDILPIKIEIIITTICLLIINLVVYFANYDNLISDIILIFGGFFGVFIGFVLPVINFISINGKTKKRSIIGYIIAGIFIFIGFFSIFYNFKNRDDLISKTNY